MRYKYFLLIFFLRVVVYGQSPYLVSKSEQVESPIVLSSSYTSSNICFLPFTNYPVLSPISMTSGDYNKDGNKDIVITSVGISVFLGTGTGSFAPAVSYTSSTGGGGRIITADFNNDTNLDIGITSGGFMEIYLGTGLGTFAPVLSYNASANAIDLAAADFNGDGNLDVVVTLNGMINGYGIFLGNGLGGMTPFISYSLLSFPLTVQCHDFNSDGNSDLAMLSGNKLLIINGMGNGNFGVPVSYSTTISDIEFTMNDFNGDSFIDIAAASGGSSGWVDVYYGNAAGNFSVVVNWYSCGAKNESIVSADFNGDGNIDIACGRFGNPGQVSLVPGIGNGSFIYPIITYTIGDVTNDVIADDFNNDGKQDIATVNKGWNSISVMLNSTPHLSVTSVSSVCVGNSATLSVVGASSYTWNTSATSSSITITPTLNTTYSVIGAIGSCTNNASTTVSVQVCTGFNELYEISRDVYLSPNPFINSFEISLNNKKTNEILTYEIYDQLMKLVLVSEFDSDKTKVEMKDSKPGIYFLRIKTNDGHSRFFKIIKQD